MTNPQAKVESKGSQHSYPFEFSIDYTVVEIISNFLHVFFLTRCRIKYLLFGNSIIYVRMILLHPGVLLRL